FDSASSVVKVRPQTPHNWPSPRPHREISKTRRDGICRCQKASLDSMTPARRPGIGLRSRTLLAVRVGAYWAPVVGKLGDTGRNNLSLTDSESPGQIRFPLRDGTAQHRV